MAASVAESHGRSYDFCNSFWGSGDVGTNVLLTRMRGATKTTEEIRRFWIERAAIEEQYAARLRELSKFPLGGDEIGELLHALETLRKETEVQANVHTQLAQAIKTQLETPTSHLFARQANHRKNFQAPVERKLKTKKNQEGSVLKTREKYEGDCLRIMSYTQQCSFAQGKDLERAQVKLQRSQQSAQADEKDLADFTQTLQELLPGWEADWKEFCDRSQDLEEDRLEFMLNTLWLYANEVSQVCVNDDQSCERIRTALEQLEPAREILQFVADNGTGNAIMRPAPFVPYDPQDPASASQPTGTTRSADFMRVSRRIIVPAETVPEKQLSETNGSSSTTNASTSHSRPSPESISQKPVTTTNPAPSARQQQPSQRTAQSGNNNEDGGVSTSTWLHRPPTGPPSIAPPPPPDLYIAQPVQTTRSPSPTRQPQRTSQPLPTPQHARWQEQPPLPTQSPPSPPPETGQILFYVRALFDYTATIDEEFSFQAGDIIAVTATPDDGWWSGELLDEERKEEGRHVFPSNFVELF